MKTFSFQPLRLIVAATIICSVWSCSKDAAKPTTTTEQDLTSTALLHGEIASDIVTPGVYRIFRFIDTGDDETAQFNGYTFQFQADGDLVATTNTGAVFNGRYRLNSAETRMNIVIGGTPALEDLDDDDWRVDRLTTTRIRISAPDPDIVVFTRIQ
jgi:hypothetical protein